MGKGTQAIKGFVWLSAFVFGLAPRMAQASHLDELRRVGQGIDVPNGALVLGASLTFLALAVLIFFGLRYLRHTGDSEDI